MWALYLTKVSFLALVLPVWEGYDEFSHFATIQSIAVDGKRPAIGGGTSREVVQSLTTVPLPWMLRDKPRVDTHDTYWQLPEGERRSRERSLRKIVPLAPGEDSVKEEVLYEAQQPPLYYWLQAGLYRLVADRPLADRVMVLRIAGLVVGSLLIPLLYVFGRMVFGSREAALCTSVIGAAFPELAISVSRVSNEQLTPAAGALAMIAIGAAWRKPETLLRHVFAGVCLGLCLLIKAYFWAIVPVYVAICFAPVSRVNRLRTAAWCGIGLMTALLIAGWHYERTWSTTGTLTGEQHDVASKSLSLSGRLALAGEISWPRVLDATFFSHIWFGGWSFLVVRGWMYRVFGFLYLWAGIGVIGFLWLRARLWGKERLADANLVVMGSLCMAFFCLGLGYHAVVTGAVQGVAATCGWYVYALVSVEAVLLALGVKWWLPEAGGRWIGVALVTLLTLLELFATNLVMLPYYAGLTRHVGTKAVPAVKLTQIADTGLFDIFQKLGANKPEWVTPQTLLGLWTLYLVACVLLVAIGIPHRRGRQGGNYNGRIPPPCSTESPSTARASTT